MGFLSSIRELAEEHKKKKSQMTEEHIGHRNVAATISVFMLLLAIPRLPYGYYILLRWVVSLTALFSTWVAYECKYKSWVFMMGGITILFNPIIPVYLPKATWIVIDFVTAIILLVSIFHIKPKRKAWKRGGIQDLERLMRERDKAFLKCWEKGMRDEELAKKFNLGIEGVNALKGRLRREELK